jgi:hypothetical protein
MISMGIKPHWPLSRLADAKLFDTFQLGHRDKNPIPDPNGHDVPGFDLPS